MDLVLIIFSLLLIVMSVLPFVKNQHWVFRVPEFMKVQLLVLQGLSIALNIFLLEKNLWFWVINGVQVALVVYHFYILIRYTKFYRRKVASHNGNAQTIKVISANIYQFNTKYEKFHQLIRNYSPDVFITFESNAAWEEANRTLEKKYPHTQKMTLENTYGMHLYSKIPFDSAQFHFFVAEDIPSVEVHFTTSEGNKFVLFGVHPPPPSPTEERTSKERDGDLLALAKRIKAMDLPSLVIGDFNTVAWSDTSILFRKTSELIDARVGRGILATFHAKYWFFRVPLDLLFHSPDIMIEKLQTLEDIGSDHFPIYCAFYLNPSDPTQEDEVKTLDEDEGEEVDELIEEGKKEVTDNRSGHRN